RGQVSSHVTFGARGFEPPLERAGRERVNDEVEPLRVQLVLSVLPRVLPLALVDAIEVFAREPLAQKRAHPEHHRVGESFTKRGRHPGPSTVVPRHCTGLGKPRNPDRRGTYPHAKEEGISCCSTTTRCPATATRFGSCSLSSGCVTSGASCRSPIDRTV